MAAARIKNFGADSRRLGREGHVAARTEIDGLYFGMTASVVRDLFFYELGCSYFYYVLTREIHIGAARRDWESVTKRLERGDGWLGRPIVFPQISSDGAGCGGGFSD